MVSGSNRQIEPAGPVRPSPDPRNPKRPDGDAGANWVRCRECGRGAPSLKLLRHAKSCSNR